MAAKSKITVGFKSGNEAEILSDVGGFSNEFIKVVIKAVETQEHDVVKLNNSRRTIFFDAAEVEYVILDN